MFFGKRVRPPIYEPQENKDQLGSQEPGSGSNANGENVPGSMAAESTCKKPRRHKEASNTNTILDSFYSYYNDFRSFLTGSPAQRQLTANHNDDGDREDFASPAPTLSGTMGKSNSFPFLSPCSKKTDDASAAEATPVIIGSDEEDDDDVVCLGVTASNSNASNNGSNKGLFPPSSTTGSALSIFASIPTPSPQRSVSLNHRSISIDIQGKEIIPAVFVGKVLKKRVVSAGNSSGNHRLSTVTKKRNDQREKSKKVIMAKYLISHSEAKLTGFRGSEQGLRDVQEYLLKVKQYELQDGSSNEAFPTILPRSFAPSSSSFLAKAPSTIQMPMGKTSAKPASKLQSSTLSASRSSDDSSVWLQQLREKISAALAPRTRELEEFSVPQTTIYDDMLQEDEALKKKIENIKVEVPVVAEKPIIPSEEELFPPLTPEMVAAFKEMTRGSEDDEIVKAFAIPITKRDMRTLHGSNWLNDEIINFYGQLCMARANALPDRYPKIFIFNTFFYEKIKNAGYAGVRRWSKKFDVFEKDYIIIPVHMGMHWCCSVINFKKKRFEYYDSLHGKNTKCVGLLRHYLEQESLDKKKVPYDTSEWTDYIPSTCPNQHNGFDCGVFTCMFMEFTAREMEFAFRQHHMPYLRNRIAWEIKNVKLLWH